jgi:hypothetical protein
MVATRDFLYGLAIAKAGTRTCAFPLGNDGDFDEDDDEFIDEGGDVEMQPLYSANEKTLTRIAKHLLFACGNMNEDAFKHVVLFVVGCFGRHCRNKTCCRAAECALQSETLDVFDPSDPLAYADAALDLNTDISNTANAVMAMRADSIAAGKRSVFESVTAKHASILASLVYPQTCPQSLKAKCFELLREYISCAGKFYSVVNPDIEMVMRTFDGQTKTYFLAKLRDDTSKLTAALGGATWREFSVLQIVKIKGKDGVERTGLKAVCTGFDPSRSGEIKVVAVQEMEAKPEDVLYSERIGRVVLVTRGVELVVGSALTTRATEARYHIPAMTVNAFPEHVFNPAPPGKAPVYAGGGEAVALKLIADLKRHKHINMSPQYDAPDKVRVTGTNSLFDCTHSHRRQTP